MESDNQEPQKENTNIFSYILTSLGAIYYGANDNIITETVQQLGYVPLYYIVPNCIFNKKNSVFLGQFDIPMQHNKYKKKKITNLICTIEQQQAIEIYLQECLLGPENVKDEEFKQEFHASYDWEGIPFFKKEASALRKLYYDIDEDLSIKSFANFYIFDENGIVTLENNVKIQKIDNETISKFIIYDNEKIVGEINPQFIEDEYAKQQFEKATKWSNDMAKNLNEQIQDNQMLKQSKEDQDVMFEPPLFGITPLSTFSTSKMSTGFLFWINGRAALVDPPLCTSVYLDKVKIPPTLIDWIILTNCQTNKDIGILQRFVETSRMEIITTPTIINSFLRKYAKITKINQELLRRLFKFKPVVIGAPINLNGCVIRFYYTFHLIPSIGFEITNQNKSLFFTGNSFYDPKYFINLCKKKIISSKRCDLLSNIKFIQNSIIFDANNLQGQNPFQIFDIFPVEALANIYMVNIDKDKYNMELNTKNIKILYPGITNSIILDVKRHKALDYMMKLEILSLIDVFEGISLKNLRDLIDISNDEFYTKGQIVIKQGTAGMKWYIILRGTAKIYSEANPPLFPPRLFQVGDYFGETALNISTTQKTTIARRMASVVALSDLHLLTLEKQDFWFAFGEGKESNGTKILNKQGRLMKSRVGGAFKIIKNNNFFKDLTQAQQTQLEMILYEQEVKQEQVIWKSGDIPKFSICVKSGKIAFRNCPEAAITIDFKPGSFIGELDALINESELTTTLMAETDSQYFKIDRNDLLGFLRRNPGLFLAFGDSKYIMQINS